MSRPRRHLSALLWTVLLVLPAGAGPPCDRVVAVGDLHGGYEAFVDILQRVELIDDELRWLDGGSCLIQLGDIVDRGARSRELLELLIALEAQAEGRVQVLLGNHEVMNLLGDLRYVREEEFTAFAAEETAADRQAGYEQFVATRAMPGWNEARRRTAFERSFPPGWFAHRRAFAPDGRLGKWLLERPVAVEIGGTIFVHGGLTVADAEGGLEQLNRTVSSDFGSFFGLRERLIDSGLLGPLTPLDLAFRLVRIWLDGASGEDLELAESARRFLDLDKSTLLRADSPVWCRRLATADDPEVAAEVTAILDATGAERIVVGHTPGGEHVIRTRFNNRIFVIDTGAGEAYGGEISALEISSAGEIRGIYLDRSEVFSPPALDDAEIERYLSLAEVVGSKEIGSGVTRPLKLSLSLDGVRRNAAFKTVAIHKTGLTRFTDGPKVQFSDRYVYERAAYLLDRELGLGMVPVVVLRTIDGQRGALIRWVADAISESERASEQLGTDQAMRLARQRAVMRLFDALILNDDRNTGNQLYTRDWKLHLIDHSRSFAVKRQLPDSFTGVPASLPRDLLPKLESLDMKRLQPLMHGLLSKAQIKALLARRDLILKKIERDRQSFGDDMVFQGQSGPERPAQPAVGR